MREKEAFRRLMERLSNNVTLQEWELCNEDMQTVENALDKLTQIENVDGSEVMEALDKIYNEPFDILKLDNAPLSAVPQFANFAKTVRNFILKSQQQEKESSELKSKVGNFIDKHMAYPYGENGELFDDEYTKDYVELKELVGEDDE